MTIREKAEELREEIANSRQLQLLREAEQALQDNQEAKDMLTEYENKQKAFKQARAEGRNISPEEHEKMIELHRKMIADPTVKDFIDSQRHVYEILNEVNKILFQAIQHRPDNQPQE